MRDRFTAFVLYAALGSIAGCGTKHSMTAPADGGLRFDGVVIEGPAGGLVPTDSAGQQTPNDAADSPSTTDTAASPVANDAGAPFDAPPWTWQTTPLANPTVSDQGGRGNVTTYGGVNTALTSSGGACNYELTGIHYYAAINVNVVLGDGLGQWRGGRACGQCARVWIWTKTGLRETFVRITDKCPDGFCGIDLGGAPAAELMDDQAGRYDGGWDFISCAGRPELSDGPTSLHVKGGSSAGWAAVQVRNPDWPVAAMEWTDTATGQGGALPYADGIENYYLVPLAALAAPAPLRITARFTDGSARSITLSAAQVGTADATYPFP